VSCLALCGPCKIFVAAYRETHFWLWLMGTWTVWQQETQLLLTNRATHLCKCNDVADLTSVIKIRLKRIWFLASGLSTSLKVIGTDTDRSAIYDFLLVFYSNTVPKTHRFWEHSTSKCRDLENRVRGPSRSVKMSPFDWAHATSYWCSIVTMTLSSVVSETFNVEKCRELEIRVRGHSRLLKVVPFDI